MSGRTSFLVVGRYSGRTKYFTAKVGCAVNAQSCWVKAETSLNNSDPSLPAVQRHWGAAALGAWLCVVLPGPLPAAAALVRGKMMSAAGLVMRCLGCHPVVPSCST